MKFDIPGYITDTLGIFEKEGFEVYIVGGAIHDLLMKRPIDDWDFATNATPEQILSFLPKDAFYDNAFGTVMLPHEKTENPLDITTFRTEHGYSDTRRPDKVVWGKTIKEDLQRRDFTINAMALKRKDKTGNYDLVDPFGGQKDIDSKLIRAVGDANERFSEDALRMMRAIRIAAELGFKIEETTFEAIKTNSSLINKIAKERVHDELIKILASPNPYEGMVMFKDSSLMDEILPELTKTFGVEQKSPGRHHIYDVGTHSMLSLKYCKSTDPIVRFAALIHDIGKPQTYKKLKNGTITFYNHEMVSTKIAQRISKRLRFSKKDTEKLINLVRWHQFSVDEHQTDKAIRRFLKNVGPENVEDMLDLRTADRLGSGAKETSWRLEDFKKRLIEVQKQPFTVHDLKITGGDVMKELNMKPGPEVGKILDQLFEEVCDKKVPNERKALLKRLKEINND